MKHIVKRINETIAYYATPNENNELPPFCMAVIYCINNYYKNVKKQTAK